VWISPWATYSPSFGLRPESEACDVTELLCENIKHLGVALGLSTGTKGWMLASSGQVGIISLVAFSFIVLHEQRHHAVF
jgi:hypothetical protein